MNSLEDTYELNNGIRIPCVGLGTWQSKQEDAYLAALTAIDCGYRHIDTAAVYRNEGGVGKAVEESSIGRSKMFITTKLSPYNHGYENATEALKQSLNALGTDYVDLYLIHWPGVSGEKKNSESNHPLRSASWRAMEKLYEEGYARAIGVSNYTIAHLEQLAEESSVTPAVNQVEFHPRLYQSDLLEYCNENKIMVEAYSPLGVGNLLKDDTIRKIAEKYKRTPAQILIRWSLQLGLVVLPKSVHTERIRENARVFDFELEEKDMDTLKAMSEGYHYCWDPTGVL